MPTIKSHPTVAVLWTVRGQVQGVGFRPFAYRLACELGITGWVRNDPQGVSIHVEGEPSLIRQFRERLIAELPTAARIESLSESTVFAEGYAVFRVVPSVRNASTAGLRVPPDRVICPACRVEVDDSLDRRYQHPFANCTDCGPRYTIITDLPYDRLRTAMAGFDLCEKCAAEYADPEDRRFHAQPVCCPRCGPRLSFRDLAFREAASNTSAVVAAVECLRSGGVVALKVIGGYQLLVRADEEAAVRRLRERKQRPTKPLAVLVARLSDAERLARVTEQDAELLQSPAGPIVLLERHHDSYRTASITVNLAENIAPGVNTLGLMLPSSALHQMIVRQLGVPLVVTSGNRSGEPIAVTDTEACRRLSGIADSFLTHDRPIVHRADDSVVRVIAGSPMTLRVGRGLAPLPIPALERWARDRATLPIIALGGEQKSAVALWTGVQAVLGAHLGDLDDPETEIAFRAEMDELPRLYVCQPEQMTCDAHPDYASSRIAAEWTRPVLPVYHHHAHAAAVMAEHGLLDREVLALTWDGTGLGPDGSIWGGEVLLATVRNFTRVASLFPFSLPGGEAAIREPRRIGLVLAAAAVGVEAAVADHALLARLGYQPGEAAELLAIASRPRFSPICSSLGRLFDGIASLLLGIKRVSYEGEAAMALEAWCQDSGEVPQIVTEMVHGIPTLDWRPFIRKLLTAIQMESDRTSLATEFHTLLACWAVEIAGRWPERPVVLGGGCFQNRRLAETVLAALNRVGRAGYLGSVVPPNDGGLAVGQLAVRLASDTEG